MITKTTIEVDSGKSLPSDYSVCKCWPDDARRKSIKEDYMLLPPAMRSVASQVAIISHLETREFPTIAALIQTLNYSSDDSTQDKLPNFWYKLRAGRAVTQSNTLNSFFDAIDLPTAELLRHPLWFFFDNRKPIKVLLTQVVERCRVNLVEIDKRWRFFKSLPLSIKKHPSSDVRMSIFTDRPFDLFTVLLFKTLIELKECNQPRPTPTEQYVYALFLFLFGYKYKILKRMQLSRLVNILLTPNSTSASRLHFERRINSEIYRVNQIADSYSQKNKDEVEVQLSDFILQRSLSKYNKCFS